jgi:hypothetical protein
LIGVAQVHRACAVETDVVPRNGVVGGARTDDLDAIYRVGRNDIAIDGIGAADLVAGTVLNKDADLIPLRSVTRGADAEIVA